MASSAVPVYFETCWSILSTIGLMQVVFGSIVISITTLSGLSLLPVIVGVACAIANGLCYYAFYAHYPIPTQLAASGVADIMWLVQEAGLSFYSYQILLRILRGKVKVTFLALFWTLMAAIVTLRLGILVFRIKDISAGSDIHQNMVNHFQTGYFISIALCECLNSFFLLRSFITAHRNAKTMLSRSVLTGRLIRSTETRVATLALIGITRSITYSYQKNAQSANNVASQVDRFVYTLECLFPFVMMIDLLASRLAEQTTNTSKKGRYNQRSTTGHAEETELDISKQYEHGIHQKREILILETHATIGAAHMSAEIATHQV